jgi:cobalamin synthase
MQLNAKVERLIALGAYGVVAGVLVLYGFVVALAKPISVGGPNGITFAVVCIAVAVPCAALIAAHLALAAQLRTHAATRPDR